MKLMHSQLKCAILYLRIHIREEAQSDARFTTHYIIGMKAYNDLKNNQLKHIIAKYRWLYQLGVQGPDIFSTISPSCGTETTAMWDRTCTRRTWEISSAAA